MMGFLANNLPAAVFVALAMALGAFTVAVKTNSRAREFYERDVREPLETSEFLFTWIGLFYFVLPIGVVILPLLLVVGCIDTFFTFSFTIVNDWRKTFYDCFTPFTIWMDVIYSSVVIILFITFLGGISENSGRISIEYAGMALLLSCVYGYVMLKSTNDPSFCRWKARKQNIWALAFLLGFGLASVLQLQFEFVVPPGGEFKGTAWSLAVIGALSQMLQPIVVVFFRSRPRVNFEDDDDRGTKNIKISAALVRVVTLTYEVWSCTNKRYWQFKAKVPYAVMITGSLAVSLLQLMYRYLGPTKVKAIFDSVIKLIIKLSSCARENEEIRRRSESTELTDHLKTLKLRVVTL